MMLFEIIHSLSDLAGIAFILILSDSVKKYMWDRVFH